MTNNKGRLSMINKRRYLWIMLLNALVGTGCGVISSHEENGLRNDRKTVSGEVGLVEGAGECAVSGEMVEENTSEADRTEENSYIDSEGIKDYPWMYNDEWFIIEEYEQYGEKWELPYVDDEIFATIKAAYAEIEYNGEFEMGDPQIYDEYRRKFWELLQGRRQILDYETGEESSIADCMGYDPVNPYYIYYFFDIDGDGCPDLGIDIDTTSRYFLRYEKETDEFSMWCRMSGYWERPIGTRKIMEAGNGKFYNYVLLDENAEIECRTYFFHEYYSRRDDLYMVTLPTYADVEQEVRITQEMEAQGAYVRYNGQWYFRLTEEQYDELTEPYFEAYWKGQDEIENILYSYNDLFGDFIQAESQ